MFGFVKEPCLHQRIKLLRLLRRNLCSQSIMSKKHYFLADTVVSPNETVFLNSLDPPGIPSHKSDIEER